MELALGTVPARELVGPRVDCRHCGLFALCLPVGLEPGDIDLLERVIKSRRVVRRGERLFRRGERFQSVFAVKSGSIKSTVPLGGGHAQVTGFHLPGELIALDAVGAGSYLYDAHALETSSLCVVPFDRLEDLGAIVRSMQRQMLRIMSHQIRHDLLLQVLHCRMTAEERLAGFLLNLSSRFAARGFSAAEFRLSMSRDDIGNYLGLAKATVIRLFSAFESRQLVSVAHRQLRIHDLYRLESLAGLKAADLQA